LQAQGANLGNLLNGMASLQKEGYVTSGIPANPETKLLDGQKCTIV